MLMKPDFSIKHCRIKLCLNVARSASVERCRKIGLQLFYVAVFVRNQSCCYTIVDEHRRFYIRKSSVLKTYRIDDILYRVRNDLAFVITKLITLYIHQYQTVHVSVHTIEQTFMKYRTVNILCTMNNSKMQHGSN